jgi:hypothetical protein
MKEENMADIKTKEKMVTIKIPRMKKDEPDVFVSVNKRTWQIQRGVPVQVPECVAEVLQHQEEMQNIIAEFDAQHIK